MHQYSFLQSKFLLEAYYLFIGFFFAGNITQEISKFGKIQENFQHLENEFVIFQVFEHPWEPW